MIVVGIITRLLYAIFINQPIVVDQLVCLNSAKSTLLGDLSWVQTDYFQRWGFQLPLVFYEALVLKVFGTVRALYILNGIYSIITVFLIYAILKNSFSKDTALIVTAIYSVFPEAICRIDNLYNFIISTMLFLMAVYFFVKANSNAENKAKSKNNSIIKYLLVGLFLGFSYLFRTEVMICLIAFECYLIYSFIINFKKENWKSDLFQTLLNMIVLYCSYILVVKSVDLYIIYSGISANGIKIGNKYWHIVCGLTPDNHGAYCEKYFYILNIKDDAEQYAAFKSIITEIFTSLKLTGTIKFFILKFLSMWGIPYQNFNFNQNIECFSTLEYFVMIFNHFLYLSYFSLSLLGVVKKNIKSFTVFLLICIIGFFAIYVIKEASIQYRFYTEIIVLLCSSGGVEYLLNRKNKIKS